MAGETEQATEMAEESESYTMESDVRWGVRISGLGFIVYVLASLYAQKLAGDVAEITDLKELSSIMHSLDTLSLITFWSLVICIGSIIYTLSAVGAAMGFRIISPGGGK